MVVDISNKHNKSIDNQDRRELGTGKEENLANLDKPIARNRIIKIKIKKNPNNYIPWKTDTNLDKPNP